MAVIALFMMQASIAMFLNCLLFDTSVTCMTWNAIRLVTLMQDT